MCVWLGLYQGRRNISYENMKISIITWNDGLIKCRGGEEGIVLSGSKKYFFQKVDLRARGTKKGFSGL